MDKGNYEIWKLNVTKSYFTRSMITLSVYRAASLLFATADLRPLEYSIAKSSMRKRVKLNFNNFNNGFAPLTLQ